jgi:hypothetical protein
MAGQSENSTRICKIVGCDRPFYSKGWCNYHYTRNRTHGDPCAPDRRYNNKDPMLRKQDKVYEQNTTLQPVGSSSSSSIDWIKEYAELCAIWRDDPVLYVKQRLGLNPTIHQMDMLNAIKEPGAKVTARSGHGTGKSAGLAAAIWWKLECFSYSKIPCTAPSAVQLRDILWAECQKWYRHSLDQSRAWNLPPELWLSNMFEITQDKICARGAPREWFAVARTARPEQPDALQGFHASDITISEDGHTIVAEDVTDGSGHRGQIMFVVEEAGGVHDKIFEVAEGALSSRNAALLMGGNPTRSTGYFAASHKQNRSEYKCLHFRSSDSPLVAKDYRDGQIGRAHV